MTAVAAWQQGLDSEAELLAEIAELRSRENDAVAEAVTADPSKSAYLPNGPADRLRRKRESVEGRLADLREFEMPARRRIAETAQKAEREKSVRDAVVKARRIDALEEAALNRAAAAFAEFAAAWADLHIAAYTREQIADGLEAQGFVPAADPESSQDRAQFLRPFGSTIEPFPADAEVFFNAATIAATDPHADADLFAQTHPDAVPFVARLAEIRAAGVVGRAALRFTPQRWAVKAASFQPHARPVAVPFGGEQDGS